MIYLYTTIDENLSSFDDIIDILRKELGSDFQITFYTENKRCFRAFNNIKAICNTNDIIVIGKFEDIGLNDLAVKENIKYFLEKSVMLIVRDTPSTYECGISSSVNIAVLKTIYDFISNSNQKITPIRTSRRAGAGRTKLDFPENWEELYAKWEQKEITSSEFIRQSGLKKASFYNLMAEYRKIFPVESRIVDKSLIFAYAPISIFFSLLFLLLLIHPDTFIVGYEPLYIFSMLNFFKKKKAGAFLHQPYQN